MVQIWSMKRVGGGLYLAGQFSVHALDHLEPKKVNSRDEVHGSELN